MNTNKHIIPITNYQLPITGPRQRGFTLIELLVVVAIMALLIAILLPNLGAARQRAKTTVCLSNLRQLATAAFNYAGTYDGLFPLAHDNSADWDFAVTTDAAGNQTLAPGILWQSAGTGGQALRIQQCPSYTGRSATLSDPYTGYNYNTSFIGKGTGETITRPARISELAHPASTALFGDGGYYGGVTDKFMRSPEPFPQSPDALAPLTRAAGTQAYRHGKAATNAAFGDGHAETRTDRYTAGISIITPTTGFLSADNSLYATR